MNFKPNYKFTVFLAILVILVGTIFSLDKSFDLYNIKQENLTLKSTLSEYKDKVDNLEKKLEVLKSDYKNSSIQWNEERKGLLIRQSELLKSRGE